MIIFLSVYSKIDESGYLVAVNSFSFEFLIRFLFRIHGAWHICL